MTKDYSDHPDRIKWDARYSDNPDVFGRAPSRWLLHCYPLIERYTRIPAQALDIAAGQGRNSLALARRGFDVTAIDISPIGLKRLNDLANAEYLEVETVHTSVHDWDWPENRFDLVLDFLFLERPVLERIHRTCRPGGLLCFEAYTIDQLGAPVGPKCPKEYLLERDELPTLFPGFETLESREGPLSDGRVTAAWLGRRIS